MWITIKAAVVEITKKQNKDFNIIKATIVEITKNTK